MGIPGEGVSLRQDLKSHELRNETGSGMTMSKACAWIAATLGLTVTLVVAQPSHAAENIDAICEKGAGEQPLTWYTAQDPTRGDAVVEALGKKYPKIKVEALRLVTGKLAAR